VADSGAKAPRERPAKAGAAEKAPRVPPAKAGAAEKAPREPPAKAGAAEKAPRERPAKAGAGEPAARRGGLGGLRRFLLSGSGWPYLLVPFIPLAIVLELAHADAVLIFAAAAAGVIPTAALMGRSTEELAHRAGPGIGGFLNVTFGNAPELIIALFALNAGLQEVVKASIIGSVLGNILLVMGAAMLIGGLKRERQTFSATAASVQSSMLLLAAVALVMPTIFQLVSGGGLPRVGAQEVDFGPDLEHMSFIVAIILLLSYAGGLVFSLRSHRALFNPTSEAEEHVDEPWTVKKSVVTLACAGVAVGVMSEILVGSISEASHAIGLSEFFVGLIVVAIVGNAAEHWVAIYFAMRDKMDLAVNIAIGSSAQIALFAAPVLVLISFFVGPHPMSLVFNGFELGAIFLAILIANHVTSDGESTWYEGMQLLSVYAVLGVVFFYA
jgi:Ca2+:H+ antiporter